VPETWRDWFVDLTGVMSQVSEERYRRCEAILYFSDHGIIRNPEAITHTKEMFNFSQSGAV
jgi:hypothetical protein